MATDNIVIRNSCSADRVSWIDSAKAITICLVVFGHCIQTICKRSESAREMFQFIYSFHMSSFFFLSGMVFKIKSKPFAAFAKEKFLRLVLPAYCFSFFFICFKIIKKDLRISELTWDDISSVVLLKRNSLGSVYWFLPCMFILMLMFWMLTKMPSCVEVILIAIFFIANLVQKAMIDIVLPYSVEIAFLAAPFFELGLLVSRHRTIGEKIFKRNVSAMCTIISLFLLVAMRYMDVPSVSMYDNSCLSIPGYFASGAAGIILIIWSAKHVHIRLGYLCGQNTLFIYGMHCIGFLGISQKLYRIDSIRSEWLALLLCACSAATIIIILLVLILFYKKNIVYVKKLAHKFHLRRSINV